MTLSLRTFGGSQSKASNNYFEVQGGTKVNWSAMISVLLAVSSDFCATVYTEISEVSKYVAGKSLELEVFHHQLLVQHNGVKVSQTQ